MRASQLLAVIASAVPALGCGESSCYGPAQPAAHVRHVKRMQPGAPNATSSPRAPLEWGELNFLHTTDTHGWLEGHLKEANYGADWGDFQSFVADMRKKADDLDVDLVVLDTGDLHDGNGLSDTTSPNGLNSNPIFEKVNYDLLTIGNHELYLSDIAELTLTQFAPHYGSKYLTSNVQIINNSTGALEYPGAQYRYFKTKKGHRIMAFGFLYDFTGNSNQSVVTPAHNVTQQAWFQQAVNYSKPIDVFVLLGHNAVRGSSSGQTLTYIQNTIRQMRPDVPIQVFGGHTHIRDFKVYDTGSTGIESGRYCETLGWVAMNGINSTSYKGTRTPQGVPLPTQPAVKVNTTATSTPAAFQNLKYARRYLDWNRLTFAYHAEGSQSKTFDTSSGKATTKLITKTRTQENITTLYGCAPQTWCLSCAPFGAPNNIYTLLEQALAATVINQTRATTPRLIILNTGSVRFDLIEGPFTVDDSFIVNPFSDAFQFLPDVPYANAKQVISILNHGAYQKREESEPRDLSTRDFNFSPLTDRSVEPCLDASASAHGDGLRRRETHGSMTRGRNAAVKRDTGLTPGYTTSDDFGTTGDDTIHSAIPYYSQPNDFQANASFPTDGSTPQTVDLIFLDFIAPNVLSALNTTGLTYSASQVSYYLPPSFDTHAYLPAYAQQAWQKNVPNCPVGTST